MNGRITCIIIEEPDMPVLVCSDGYREGGVGDDAVNLLFSRTLRPLPTLQQRYLQLQTVQFINWQ